MPALMPAAARALQAAGALSLLLLPLILWAASATAALPWVTAALLAVLLLRLRALLTRPRTPGSTAATLSAAAGALLCAVSLVQGGPTAMLYYPVAVNALLLALFALSLLTPHSAVELLARLRHPDLDEHGVRYTRHVTAAWCIFFILNGALALLTCLHGDLQVWAIYNGVLAYILIGVMFAAEYLVRRSVLERRRGGA